MESYRACNRMNRRQKAHGPGQRRVPANVTTGPSPLPDSGSSMNTIEEPNAGSPPPQITLDQGSRARQCYQPYCATNSLIRVGQKSAVFSCVRETGEANADIVG